MNKRWLLYETLCDRVYPHTNRNKERKRACAIASGGLFNQFLYI
ncbi:hypothetical protein [Nostoc sp.]